MIRAIVVDDEEFTRDNMISCIDWESSGVVITGTASDGPSALSLILKECPDLVLIDIKMPGMSGLDVIEKVHEQELFPSFIIISGYDDFCYAQRAIQMGIDGYLLKPFRPKDLMNVIEQSVSKLSSVKKLSGQGAILSVYQDFFHKQEESERFRISYPAEEEHEVIRYLLTAASPKAAEAAAERFIDAAFAQNSHLALVLDCCMLLYAEICRVLFERCSRLQENLFLQANAQTEISRDSLYAMLCTIIRSAFARLDTYRESNQLVKRAVEYINANYHKALSLQGVAKELYVSAPYLSSLLSKCLGQGFVEYLRKVRIEKARLLLADTSLRISDISASVEFSDSRYFSQVFKKTTGLTPQEYRMHSAVLEKQEDTVLSGQDVNSGDKEE